MWPAQRPSNREKVRDALVDLSMLPSHASGLHRLQVDSQVERIEMFDAPNGAEAYIKYLAYMLCVSRFTVFDELRPKNLSEKKIHAGKMLNDGSERCLAYIMSRKENDGQFDVPLVLRRLAGFWFQYRGLLWDEYVFWRLKTVASEARALAENWEGPSYLGPKYRQAYVRKVVTRGIYVANQFKRSDYLQFGQREK